MEKGIRKNDVILIAVILIAAMAAYAGIRYYQKLDTREAVAVVTVDETEYGRFPLNQDTTEQIQLPDGSYNILVIKDGKVDITEASCPDRICVEHRPVDKKNESIVCLPNKVIVVIENGEESDVDSFTN